MRAACRADSVNITEISRFIIDKISVTPRSAVILGSGLGNFTDSLTDKVVIPYKEIPGYPLSSVTGHAGEWVFGFAGKKPVICAKGRFHCYEGFTEEEAALPVKIIHEINCNSVLITNAAGCLNLDWHLGDLMLITGFIDYTFTKDNSNPKVQSIPLFTELENNKEKARQQELELREGNYVWTLGPSYETPAEIQDIISLGGHAVGMSTVPEMRKAIELGMQVRGISCLTNYGAGMQDKALSHAEVLETTSRVNQKFTRLLAEII